jgi:hypothetical protein
MGPPKTYLPKHVFFLITNEKFDGNSHCRSETKIANTSLTGTKLTYDESKKKHKKVLVGCKHRHKRGYASLLIDFVDDFVKNSRVPQHKGQTLTLFNY